MGGGLEQNDERAFEYLTAAVEYGCVGANIFLGNLYATGRGVEQSDQIAFECYKKVAEHDGNIENEYQFKMIANQSLAECYAQGSGVVKNNDLAVLYSKRVDPDKLNKMAIEGVMTTTPNSRYAKEILPLRLAIHHASKEFDSAKEFVEKAFENAEGADKSFKDICLKTIEQAEQLDKKNQELEDMMSMFAHKFRSPLDAIIYNTTHDNQVKLYVEAAQTMRGLLDIFSMISTDEDLLKTKIKQDGQGTGRLMTVFGKTLNTVLLHLLSKSGAEKIQQHYMAYAKAHGQCDELVS